MSNTPEKELIKSLVSIKETSKYHDLIIRCGGREWKSHRAIVCPRSKFFEKACDGNFRESMTGEIVLTEDDPDTVDRMVDYLYRLDYEDEPSIQYFESPEGPLLINARVYAIADKYDISTLKTVAVQKTTKFLKMSWDEENFIAAFGLVWNATPIQDRSLRELYLPFILRYSHSLYKNEAFLELLRVNGDLAVDVLVALLGEKQTQGNGLRPCNTSLEAIAN
ncbi:hypothetical protein MMC18_000756 [Xylographa bjoerkii]|nr:hypothetical protein [Xylographa bjoerkii]